jgi:Reverse transcriptase (RNA-dependent DNA polymerase)
MFDQAKRDEIMGLIERGTIKLDRRKNAGPHPNIVPGRFVLAINTADGSASGNSGSEILKARFVLGGHRDRDRFKLVHNSTTLKQSSIRIITALASILGFRMWSTDIKQAYLQSAEDLKREIYVRPDVMKLPPYELLQFVKPLYGLEDSGDYWHKTLTAHHITKLLMEQSTGDFSFFFRKKDKELYGMSGTHVDDIFSSWKRLFSSYCFEVHGRRF